MLARPRERDFHILGIGFQRPAKGGVFAAILWRPTGSRPAESLKNKSFGGDLSELVATELLGSN
jgi:hypothetical protein